MELLEHRLDSLARHSHQIAEFRLEAQRNFRGTAFVTCMTKEAKLQVEKKVVEVLGSQFGNYTSVSKLSQDDHDWLVSIGIDPDNKLSEEVVGSGANADWPSGRGVFI